jgi:hypothetical protein
MIDMGSENNRCDIKLTKRGLEINGDCAQGLLEVFARTFDVSKKQKSEIFACACFHPETKRVEKVIIGKIGRPTRVSTEGVGRICPKDTLQVSYHTHPVSGKAKFSTADGVVIVDRFNKGYDDGHCVVGENEERCLFQTRLRKAYKWSKK